MTFRQQFEEDIALVEEHLRRYLVTKENYQKEIYEAMGYSLFAGGKRLRPVMTMEFCRMAGGKVEDAMPFGCALEMIHTYSLIHDDLPCMDDDDLRRGKPTNHKVYGEATAVLAGDALLTKAFEVAATYGLSQGIPAQRVAEAMGVLAYEAGTEGMVGGQVVDLAAEEKAIDLEELTYLENLKTSALFRAAARMGCVLGGATKEQLDGAAEFATKLGLAFQIQDDILDIEGDQTLLGKNIGSDVAQNKSTFVSLLSMEKAKEQVAELTKEAILALAPFSDHAFMENLANMLVGRDH